MQVAASGVHVLQSWSVHGVQTLIIATNLSGQLEMQVAFDKFRVVHAVQVPTSGVQVLQSELVHAVQT